MKNNIKKKSKYIDRIIINYCSFDRLLKAKLYKNNANNPFFKNEVYIHMELEKKELIKNLLDNRGNINPYWVTGFIDGDGAFMLNVSKSSSKLGFSVRPVFDLAVHKSDIFILDKIKKFFSNIGHIRKSGLYYFYRIDSIKDIRNVIIPHFDEYPLLSINNSRSYFLLKSCIKLISINKESLKKDQLLAILGYKAAFKEGFKSKVIKKYQNIIPFDINNIPKPPYSNINGHWLAGFVTADGTFGAYKRGGKYKNYYCSFRINHDKIDESLLLYISKYLNCGNINKEKLGMCGLSVYSLLDLNNIIIPFFKKYKLETSKEIDFFYFCEIVNIFNKKGYKKRWNLEDNEKIRFLTLKMNNYRRKIE